MKTEVKSPAPVWCKRFAAMESIRKTKEKAERKYPELVVTTRPADDGESIIMEAWTPLDFLEVSYPDLTLVEKIRQWERALDFISAQKWNERFKRWAGGLSTRKEAESHKATILATYNAIRADNSEAKKTWIQDRVCEKLKNRRPNTGFSLRSIKAVTRNLK